MNEQGVLIDRLLRRFGPDGPGVLPVPDVIVDALTVAVDVFPHSDPLDLALAMGCGWGRALGVGAMPWAGRWPLAVSALARILDGVAASMTIRADGLRSVSDALNALLDDEGVDEDLIWCGRCERRFAAPSTALIAWDPSAAHLRTLLRQSLIAATLQANGAPGTTVALGRACGGPVEPERCPFCAPSAGYRTGRVTARVRR